MRGLESRIKDLEKDVASSPRVQTPPVTTEADFTTDVPDASFIQEDIMVFDQAPSFDPSVTDWPVLGTPTADDDSIPNVEARRPTLHSLDEVLKNLSLEATAERHLGSSSGLSFAKLTQTVLRRLSPDRADFVFGKESTALPQLNSISAASANPFDRPAFPNFGNSMSCDPMLFGDFLLPELHVIDPAMSTELTHLFLPADGSKIDRLVDFYFTHSHTLYPIVQRREFLATLNAVRENPHASAAQSPLSLFRIWMVLAIGSTAYCSVSLADETESMLYYNKATTYFEASLAYGDMVCSP